MKKNIALYIKKIVISILVIIAFYIANLLQQSITNYQTMSNGSTYSIIIMLCFYSFVTAFLILAMLLLNLKNRICIKQIFTSIEIKKFLMGCFSCISILLVLLSILLFTNIYIRLYIFSVDKVIEIIFSMALTSIIVAFFEEIIFRWFLLNILKDSSNILFPAILSSLIFAMCHKFQSIYSLNFLVIFLCGVILFINFNENNSVWQSMGFHFTWNLFILFFIQGQDNLPSLFLIKGDISFIFICILIPYIALYIFSKRGAFNISHSS